MRVYTFTLPKFVSNIVRKCAVAFQKDSRPKTTASAGKASKTKRRKKEKTQGA